MNTNLSIGEAAKILKISINTLRRWEASGKITSAHTSGGQRRYSLDSLKGINKPQIPKPQIIHTPILLTTLISPFQKQVLGFVLTTIILAGAGVAVAKNNKMLALFKKVTPEQWVMSNEQSKGTVLAAESINDDYRFVVNVPSLFNKNITAPNIIYSLTAGDNVTITGGQNPTITSTLPDQFKNFKVGSTTLTANSKTDTLELVAGSNVTLSTSDKKITIASAVTDVTTSGITDDGTMVRLTTATDNFGLGTATGAAKLNLNVDDTRDLITASQSGNLKFRLTSAGIIDTGTWQATAIANAYLANSAVTVSAGTGLTGGGSVSLGSSVTLTSTLGTSVDLASEITGLLPLANITSGSENQILVVSAGIPAWVSNLTAPSSGSFGYWTRTGTTLSPVNASDNLSLAGNATTSGILTFTGTAAQVGTVNMRTLTLGTATTGNIVIDSGSGSIALSDNTTFSGNIDVAGSTTLNGSFTLGDNGDTGSIDTSDWDINSTGNMTGIGSITADGAISGSNLSGTNTGDQTITLTGDVTGTGTGSFATTLATVTTAKGGTNITSYTTGDILYSSATNTLAKRGIGTTGQVLVVSAGVPTWIDNANVGNWQRNLGAVAPINIGDDVLVGGISTASATFRVDSATGLITTASVNSASIVNASVANADLANSSVTVTAGTGMSGGGAVSLGSSITLTNAGVTSAHWHHQSSQCFSIHRCRDFLTSPEHCYQFQCDI